MSKPAGYARALGQGLMFGFADEAEARARSALTGRSYEEELQAVRDEYARFTQENPMTSLAAEFAGGVVPSVAGMLMPGTQAVGAAAGARTLGALGRLGTSLKNTMGFGKTAGQRTLGENLARATGVGVVQGGLSGAGSSEGSRAIGAALGAGIGGALSPFFVAAPAAIGAGYRYGRQFFNPSVDAVKELAARGLSKYLRVSPQEMAQQIADDALIGVPSMPMNVGRGMTGKAESLAQRPGEAQEIIGEAIGRQRAGQRERITGQTQDLLSDRNYYDEIDEMQERLRTQANDAYNAAYEYGAVDDPVIMQILREDPRFREAFNRAQRISNTERLNAIANNQDPTPFEMQKVYQTTGEYDPQIVATLRQMGISEERLPGYLANLGDEAMQKVEVMVPDVRTLDYIKRGLDSMITEGYRGQGMSSPEAKALKDLRDTYVNRIDALVPEYGAARRQYAGDIEVRNAAEAGFEQFDRLDPEQVSRMFNDFSEAEKDAFRAGAARQLWGVVMNPSNNADYANRIIGSPATQMKLREIFPSDATYDLFEAALKRESELFKDASNVLAGSPTARRMAAMQTDDADTLLSAAGALAQQGFTQGILSGVLGAISRRAISDDVAKKMAEWLTADDPQKVAAVVAALEQFQTSQVPRTTQRIGMSATTSGGALGAGFPAPYAPPEEE